MSTRGCFGFIIDGQLKVAYNHFDSNPTGRGIEFALLLADRSDEKISELARGIHVIAASAMSSDGLDLAREDPGLAEAMALYLERSPQSEQAQILTHEPGLEWVANRLNKLRSEKGLGLSDGRELFERLDEANGGSSPLGFWMDGYPLMRDASAFLRDSLMCEWAWIANADEGVLEVHCGFNQNPQAPGRYASGRRGKSSTYCGVALVERVPFAFLRDMASAPGSMALFDSLTMCAKPDYAKERAEENGGDPGTGLWLAARERWQIEEEIPKAPRSERPKIM